MSEGTIIDAKMHPPIVKYLDYEVQGWSGGDLIASFPVHLASPRLLKAMKDAGLEGFSAYPAESYRVSINEQVMTEFEGSYVLDFRWFKMGEGEAPDIYLTEGFLLGFSDRAWEVIYEFDASNCAVERVTE